MESFAVQFLGSVEVPYHQGNGILCAAMQKANEKKKNYHMMSDISDHKYTISAKMSAVMSLDCRLPWRGRGQCISVLLLCVSWK